LFERGDTAEALHHLSEAVRADGASPEAVANLRFALAQLGVADADAYVEGLHRWAAAVAADRGRPGAATYSARLMGPLLAPHVDAVRGCIAANGGPPAPFSVFVTLAADGAVEDVAVMPTSPVARCLGDELRAGRAPAPPFAPFHAQMEMRFTG